MDAPWPRFFSQEVTLYLTSSQAALLPRQSHTEEVNNSSSVITPISYSISPLSWVRLRPHSGLQ